MNAQRRRPATWIVGGLLWILIGLLKAVAATLDASYDESQIRVSIVLEIVAAVLLLAACALYAFGLRPEESIVARRPVGMSLLLAFGVAELAYRVWWATPAGYGAGPAAGVQQGLAVLVTAVLTLLCAVSIARAGAVDAPWRWVPLAVWVTGIVLLAVFGLVLPLAVPDGQAAAVSIIGTAALGAAAPLTLGICSIIAALASVAAIRTPSAPAL